jgi:hypothetical protein
MNPHMKNLCLGVLAPTAGRMISNLDQVEQWLRIASLSIGVAVGFVSLTIGAIQLYRIMRQHFAKKAKPTVPPSILPLMAIAGVLVLSSGCSFNAKTQQRAQGRVYANSESIAEQSRTLTTAIVDTLSLAPTNEPTLLALEFAQRDQQLEGIPQERIDVAALLAHDKAATKALADRYRVQADLLTQKSELEKELHAKDAQLIELGKKYEAEKNRSIVKRVWRSLMATIGIGGIVALFIFVPGLLPIVIPIAGRVLSWIVSMFPKLAGFVGVVGTKAFDAVVKGVHQGLSKAGDSSATVVKQELSKSMDQDHKALVAARKPQVIPV